MYDLEHLDKRKLIFGAVFLLANRLQTVMDQELQDFTAKQWFVLMVLDLFEDAPTLKQLAHACDSSHQNTKQLVLKLESKGFVTIEQDASDKRAMRIYKTEKCAQWDKENQTFVENFLEIMFQDLTEEELLVFSRAQQKVYAKLEKMKEGRE